MSSMRLFFFLSSPRPIWLESWRMSMRPEASNPAGMCPPPPPPPPPPPGPPLLVRALSEKSTLFSLRCPVSLSSWAAPPP